MAATRGHDATTDAVFGPSPAPEQGWAIAGWGVVAEGGQHARELTVRGDLISSNSFEFVGICAEWDDGCAGKRDTVGESPGTGENGVVENNDNQPEEPRRANSVSSTASSSAGGSSAASAARSSLKHLAGPGFQFARGIDGKITIGSIAPGGPAGAEGSLAIGDELISVDGVECAQASARDVRDAILGALGSTVRIKVFRHSAQRAFDITLERGSTEGWALSDKLKAMESQIKEKDNTIALLRSQLSAGQRHDSPFLDSRQTAAASTPGFVSTSPTKSGQETGPIPALDSLLEGIQLDFNPLTKTPVEILADKLKASESKLQDAQKQIAEYSTKAELMERHNVAMEKELHVARDGLLAGNAARQQLTRVEAQREQLEQMLAQAHQDLRDRSDAFEKKTQELSRSRTAAQDLITAAMLKNEQLEADLQFAQSKSIEQERVSGIMAHDLSEAQSNLTRQADQTQELAAILKDTLEIAQDAIQCAATMHDLHLHANAVFATQQRMIQLGRREKREERNVRAHGVDDTMRAAVGAVMGLFGTSLENQSRDDANTQYFSGTAISELTSEELWQHNSPISPPLEQRRMSSPPRTRDTKPRPETKAEDETLLSDTEKRVAPLSNEILQKQKEDAERERDDLRADREAVVKAAAFERAELENKVNFLTSQANMLKSAHTALRNEVTALKAQQTRLPDRNLEHQEGMVTGHACEVRELRKQKEKVEIRLRWAIEEIRTAKQAASDAAFRASQAENANSRLRADFESMNLRNLIRHSSSNEQPENTMPAWMDSPLCSTIDAGKDASEEEGQQRPTVGLLFEEDDEPTNRRPEFPEGHGESSEQECDLPAADSYTSHTAAVAWPDNDTLLMENTGDTSAEVRDSRHTISLARGETGGIGLVLHREAASTGPFAIKRMAAGGAAQVCQELAVGDELHEIDDVSVHDMRLDQLKDAILGAPGTAIRLTVVRPVSKDDDHIH